MVDLIIELTEDERAQIESVAQERGFRTASDYVRALIEQAVEDEIDIRAEFKQAWREVKTGDVISLDEMWQMLDDE